MKVAVLKEIKDNENRVALTPNGAKELVKNGHEVLVETSAGINSGFSDDEYKAAGAKIVTKEEAWGSDMMMKVKEPFPQELRFFKKDQIIFTYLHLAGVYRELTDALLKSKVIAVAYETVEDENGKLPLLRPMSEVSGRMAVIIGSYYLAKFNGGEGILASGVPGVKPAKIMILGSGTVGSGALEIARGIGAEIILFTRNPKKLEHLVKESNGKIRVMETNEKNISEAVKEADILIGGVLIPGGKAPHLVTEEMVKTMKKGSVIVDISIDQGGCVETSHGTSHSDPVYVKHGVIHYAVTNMPGAYPRTSTFALTNATLPYAIKLANSFKESVKNDPGLAKGINTYNGHITCKPVAHDMGMMDKYKDLNELL